MLWAQKNVDHLPTSILIDAPHVVKNDFDVKFVIENKLNRVCVYESEPFYLNVHSMNNQFKIVDLERSK
jgi:hypothetical protein